MIHCLGDSHRDIFWEINQFLGKNIFSTYNIKSTLAYNLENEKHYSNELITNTLNYIQKFDSNPIILMIFGEIDCRCHIVKQAILQNISLEESTEKVVNNYIIGLKRLIDRGYNINVWGPVASTNDNYLDENKIYPHIGTNQERNYVTKLFNDLLNNKCKEIGYNFFTIFEKLLSSDGTTNENFYKEDKVHLSLNAINLIITCLKEVVNK